MTKRQMLLEMIQKLPDESLNKGFVCEAVGIEDGHAPSRERALRILYILSSWRQSDLCFAVHCGRGRGRTGTILAFYLMAFEGMSFTEAYREVRSVFPSYIETSSQTKFLGEQAPYLIAERKKETDPIASICSSGVCPAVHISPQEPI